MKAFGWQAQRVADTAVGAAVTGGEKVVDTIRPLTRQGGVRREAARVRRDATTGLRGVERRGAATRKRVQRQATRQRNEALRLLKRRRRDVERHTRSTRREFERRADGLQGAAVDALRRVDAQGRAVS